MPLVLQEDTACTVDVGKAVTEEGTKKVTIRGSEIGRNKAAEIVLEKVLWASMRAYLQRMSASRVSTVVAGDLCILQIAYSSDVLRAAVR